MIDSMIFLYISYKTIAAIDNPDEIAGNPEKYVDVLKLWGCYAVYTVIEKSLSIIMFFTPLSIGYYTSKLAFYFWILKHSNNVNLFYDSVIAPLYCRYKKDVDAGVLSIEKYIRLTLITIITYMNVIKNILIRYVASRIEVLQIDDIDKKLKLIESH